MPWPELLAELVAPDSILTRKDDGFNTATTLLNSATKSSASALVRPTTASQVSAIVKFALSHSLTVSVKSGGFNTAGWSIKGDIIIDLARLSHISIATPSDSSKLHLPPLADTLGTAVSPIGHPGDRGKKRAASMSRAAHEASQSPPSTSSSASSEPANSRVNKGHRSSSRASSSEGDGTGEAGDGQNVRGASSKAKGKAREDISEGTRSWVAGQAKSPSESTAFPHFDPAAYFAPVGTPSFAASFANSPLSSILPLDFRDTSAFSSSAGPSNGGYVFNSSAFAPSSTFSPPQIATSASVSSPNPSTTSAPTATFHPHPRPLSVPSPASTDSTVTSPASSNLLALTSSSATSSTNSSRSSSSSGPTSSFPYAIVTLGAGAHSKAIDALSAPLDYYVPLAAYPSGCAIFMSGGFGYLSRLHGLSMDNVTEAEIVLPDGRIIFLNEDVKSEEERDLWWAFRGAGLAMGIVTRLRVKAFRVGLVFSGNLI
ncbi:hypothetical protein P7C70_g451, partial [Phenoliferia sp. Uapishka_3]